MIKIHIDPNLLIVETERTGENTASSTSTIIDEQTVDLNSGTTNEHFVDDSNSPTTPPQEQEQGEIHLFFFKVEFHSQKFSAHRNGTDQNLSLRPRRYDR